MSPEPEFPCSVRMTSSTGRVADGHICAYGQYWVKVVKLNADGTTASVSTIPREHVQLITEEGTLIERNRPLIARFNIVQARLREEATAAQQSSPQPQVPPPRPAPGPAYVQPQPSEEKTLDEM